MIYYIVLILWFSILDKVKTNSINNDIGQIFQFNCFVRPNGLYADVSSRCKVYHLCYKSRKYSFRCKANEAFDETKDQCSQANFICQSRLADDKRCSNVADGYYPDLSYSERYIECKNEDSIERICPRNFTYDGKSKTCKSLIKNNPYLCDHQLNGHFNDRNLVCRGYYSCESGINHMHVCPPETVFNFGTLSCDRETTCAQVRYTCADRSDGSYVDYESGCSSFYICKNGDLVAWSRCPIGAVLDVNAGKCIQKPDNYNCVKQISNLSCFGKPNGHFHVEKTRCKVFYKCLNEEVVSEGKCGAGETFDLKLEQCRGIAQVECDRTTRTGSHDFCNGLPSGLYPDYHHKCQRYHICEGNFSTIAYCSEGFLFNAMQMVCDHAQNVKCAHPDPEQRQQGVQRSGCPFNTKFYADYASNCRKFHICYDGVKKTYQCPSNLVFNPKTSECDEPPNVDCSPSECSTINDLRYHLHPGTNCTRYFRCIKDNIEWYSCPPGELFDAKSSTCEKKIQVSCAELLVANITIKPAFDCSERADGYYADYKKSCHVFYRCIRGKKYSHYCKRGLLFNPDIGICDFELNVNCSEHNNT